MKKALNQSTMDRRTAAERLAKLAGQTTPDPEPKKNAPSTKNLKVGKQATVLSHA